jgi:hypothetical protein
VTARTNNPDTTATGGWCSVCTLSIFLDDEAVECADWPGRWHHAECAGGCVECKGALMSERNRW